MTYEVRRVSGDDWWQWRELRLRALQDSPEAFCSTVSREQAFTEADWRARLDGTGCSVLATEAGRAVGMGAAWAPDADTVQVVSMWVDPGHRGRGVARAVLDDLVAWAGERTVVLDVATANPGARRLYETAGFVATGRVTPMREGSTANVEEMVLRR